MQHNQLLKQAVQQIWSTFINETCKLHNNTITMKQLFESNLAVDLSHIQDFKPLFEHTHIFDVLNELSEYFNPDNQTPATPQLIFQLFKDPKTFTQLYIIVIISKKLNQFMSEEHLTLTKPLTTTQLNQLKQYVS